MRWELACWCLLGSVGTWFGFKLWPTTELCEFNAPGFVAKEVKATDEHTCQYVLYVPREYDGVYPLPLIVFLHGNSVIGFDGRQQLKTGLAPEVWLRHHNAQPFPYFVLFPQSERPWSDESADIQVVVNMLDDILDAYLIDQDRVYLTGISGGCSGLWKLAAAYPERWAALVPVSYGSKQAQIRDVKSLPIRWYQNSGDNIEEVRRIIVSLKRAGNSVELIEYDDLSRDAWTRAYAAPGLYDWLNHQVRHPSAKRSRAGML